MGDNFQTGRITTLHRLVDRPIEELEAELVRFSLRRPMGLILPSLYSELEGPALPNIVNHLAKVPYLSQIVIGLDQASELEYKNAVKFFSNLPQNHQILWNDGPSLMAIDEELREMKLAPQEMGKGRNVWYCMGYMLALDSVESVGLHDCDILTYDRSLLARLMYPIANPNFRFQFCKGYYSRIAGKYLGGRVSRLLVTPLTRSLQHILGSRSADYLSFIDSFRYPLAGEFALRKDVMAGLRISSDWGLEIGLLMEMLRSYTPRRICQVDIADVYDHKHQSLSQDNDQKGLSKMSIDISKAFFRKLSTDGVIFDMGLFRTIKATYLRLGLDLVDSYRCDADMNGLDFDVDVEERMVELFSENIMKAGESFLQYPMEQPFIPHWNRVVSAIPDIYERMIAAVNQDREDFGV